MAVIAFVEAEIKEVFTDPGHCEQYMVRAGETITAGQIVCWGTTGSVLLADGNAAALDEPWAVAMSGGVAGTIITVLKKGHVEGFTVNATATGTLVNLTDNPGEIEGAGAGECVGRVVALSGGAAVDRVIHFDICGCLAGLE